ncbi:MAG: dihydrofolate reductase family protein [Gammaproteobacteria bacterium]
MRRVIVSNLVSLDGYIAAVDGDLGWFAVGPEFFAYAQDLMGRVDTILFGRVTYQMMESYWTSPAAAKNDPFVTKQMNELPKVVFSRTLKHAAWGKWDNTSLSADPVATVTQLKSKAGGDMVIFGSGGLVSALAPHGLIDEYRMIINPSILGQGIPMFHGFKERIPLKLAANRSFDDKMVMLTYHPEKIH